jgi:2-polyprenyl-6-methoxyphenol hydroxylase-like FAD-dependent oxidoreductase
VALCLARAGHEVEVHERAPSLRQSGTGLGLQPNGLAVLDALGVLDTIRAAGSDVDALGLFGAGHRALTSIKVTASPPVDVAGVIATRAVVVDALASAVASAGLPICFGSTVTNGHGGSARIESADGIRVEHADLVVAADGAGSRLRTAAGLPARPSGRRRWYVRFLSPVPSRAEEVGEHWVDGGIVGVIPCGADQTYLFCTASPEIASAHEARDNATVRTLLTDRYAMLAPYLQPIESADSFLVNDVRAVRCRRFAGDRLVLLGDAAHAMAPNLGQGANSALVDAAVLTVELACNADLPAALAAYEQRRIAAVHRVQRHAELMAFIGHLRHGRTLRDAIIRRVPERAQARAVPAIQQCDPTELAVELRATWSVTKS